MEVEILFPIKEADLSGYFGEFELFAQYYEPAFPLDSYGEYTWLGEMKDAYKEELMKYIEYDIKWHFDRITETY